MSYIRPQLVGTMRILPTARQVGRLRAVLAVVARLHRALCRTEGSSSRQQGDDHPLATPTPSSKSTNSTPCPPPPREAGVSRLRRHPPCRGKRVWRICSICALPCFERGRCADLRCVHPPARVVGIRSHALGGRRLCACGHWSRPFVQWPSPPPPELHDIIAMCTTRADWAVEAYERRPPRRQR